MEDLSTEEKAKRFDDLLVRLQKAKVDNNVCDERYCCVIDDIVPELKESEDELTWLTKYIEEEAYSLSMDIRDNEDRIKLKKLQRSLAWLEKHLKASKVEAAMREVERKSKLFTAANKGETSEEILAQMKGEWWNKEDEKMLDSFLHKLEVCDLLTNKENNWILDKFKSLKDRYTWKPSKQAKEALLWCVVHLGGADKQTLGELLEALNKL